MKSRGTLLALLLVVSCGSDSGSSPADQPANPCATPGATYLQSFMEVSGDCGPLPRRSSTSTRTERFTTNTKVERAKVTQAGCTVRDTGCKWLVRPLRRSQERSDRRSVPSLMAPVVSTRPSLGRSDALPRAARGQSGRRAAKVRHRKTHRLASIAHGNSDAVLEHGDAVDLPNVERSVHCYPRR